MSSRIKDTLLNHEVAPPEGSWQQIATALDEAANGYRFPEKLYQLEITAPSSSWDIISQQLDEAAQEGTVAEKLYAAELTPPIAAWNHIQLALETEDAVAQPVIKRFYPFWKYAVAAIVIGFLGFAAWQFLLSPEKTAITPIASINTPELEALTHASAGIDAALNNEEESVRLNTSADPEAREAAALESSKKTFAKLDFSPARRAAIAASFSFDELLSPEEINDNHHLGFAEAIPTTGKKDDRYVVLMTPDGHFIRMSKKLGNMVCCVAGEEKDTHCSNMMDKWQKQLACSDAAHPGNFMDILSLVSSLEEQ
ncbi:MAG: hypothetical protein IPP99_22725 [Chitinophagaceae bacterium]|nr:hypothetical protein [Chitinophagaceae bacterium]